MAIEERSTKPKNGITVASRHEQIDRSEVHQINKLKEKSKIMSKTPKEKQTIESLLEREKNKNRRILTAVIFTLAFAAGFITSYFVMRNELSNIQANAISAYSQVASKAQK